MSHLADQEDLYATLGVQPCASAAQLKARYQALVRATHPDKGGAAASGTAFQRVQLAWQTLGEPTSRALYDRQLAAARLSGPAAVEDELALAELEWRADLEAFWRDCRCGDGFRLPRHELTAGALLVPCDSCSLTICVLVPADGDARLEQRPPQTNCFFGAVRRTVQQQLEWGAE
ncbi:dnaJ homolog subfamily C member 24-like [Pollicipes pollicipes]|uniref:dnaJ homolog subfamily C member 24-like n=1 Tax=Pollicipes pollicipes TaxID=41117 RepID=UPI001885829D|nr:dnaJ homolog subfamily C member 24-like [Pollicipes pollicipes]